MLKKRIIILLLLLVLPFTLIAEELQEAFDVVYNGLYASVASYFSVPRVSIDGISFELDSTNSQITKIAFNRVDLAKVLIALKKDGKQMTWYQKLMDAATSSLSPIVTTAVETLAKKNYLIGEAILDGSVNFDYKGYYQFKNLLDLFVKSDWSDLSFSFTLSMIVSGTRFSSPLLFEGLFNVVGSQNQKMKVECVELKINNERFEVTPLIFSN